MTQAMEENITDPKVLQSQAAKRAIFIKKAFFGLIIVLVVITLLAVGYYVFIPKSAQKPPSPSISTSVPENKLPNQIVAKVGQESIYQQNLDNQIATYPAASQQKQVALEQLTTDSIILQAGAKDGLIKLDNRFYNSKNMDLKLRAFMVEKVKNKIQDLADTVSGSVVSIWFLNTKVGPLGYEKAKALALKKITPLYEAVKAKKMTMREAAKAISSDTSLSQLDPTYKSNAYFEFTTTLDKPPTHSTPMNQALMALPIEGLTDIFTVQSEDIDQHYAKVDAYYSFGTVTNRTKNGQIISFDDWLKKAKEQYNVQTY